jgi:cytoskeleton protein RodZ
MSSLGDEFRVARETRGLSLSDVAEHLHIRSVYLQAIEDEDWAVIGAPVYIRGFIRTYARFLGIDPEKAIEAFNQVVPSTPPTKQWSSAVDLSGTVARRRPSIFLWVAGVIALALVAYVGYGYSQLKPTARSAAPPVVPTAVADGTAAARPPGAPPAGAPPPPPPPPPAPAPAPPAAAPTPAPHPTRPTVRLRLTELSWLRVDVDGNTVLEGEFPPGTTRDFHGKRVKLLIGNAGGVEVTAPGQPTQLLGSPGQVVEREYTLTGGKAE